VVLIDISLRSGSGFDVLKVLKEQNLAPVAIKVVLTNHPEYRDVCTLLGADEFFDKSMEMTQALAFISAMVVQGHHAGRMIPTAQPSPL
jgi:DNA-binding NarL/FixJ family response regulator